MFQRDPVCKKSSLDPHHPKKKKGHVACLLAAKLQWRSMLWLSSTTSHGWAYAQQQKGPVKAERGPNYGFAFPQVLDGVLAQYGAVECCEQGE